MTRERVAGLATAAVGPPVWCAVLGGLLGGDPLLAVEIGGAALALVWTVLMVRDVITSHRIARRLSADARELDLFGVRCRVTSSIGAEALVIGLIRPQIYVGQALVATLARDELQAVVYHEDHHRRVRAPIRAAALGAWLRLVGRSERLRGLVLNRLADLEALADADAIRRGSSPRSLARALLKGELSGAPVSFSYAADRRVTHLLDTAAGIPTEAADRVPYEWLPVALLATVLLGCHIGL